MITKSNLPGRRFYLLWVVINSIIMVLAEFGGFTLLLGIAFGDVGWHSLEVFLSVVTFSGIASASLGIGQWFILRKHFRQIGLWVVATTVGWSLTLLTLYFQIPDNSGHKPALITLAMMTIIIGGISVGLCQWWVIRQLHLAGWWIVFVILDIILSLIIGGLINVGVPGIAFGLITGWGVIWLHQNQPDSLPSAHD
ncbi:MAG: hypothetical protein H6658_12900 [Ardenticatenaceae bacterium]|nr:hypothetical protein [Ardenticatenaceae bacterium]